MLRINNKLLGISKQVLFTQKKYNATDLTYYIYSNGKTFVATGTSAKIWEDIIDLSIIEKKQDLSDCSLNHFIENNLIVEYENNTIYYKKMPYSIIRKTKNNYYIVNTLLCNITKVSPRIATALENNNLNNLNTFEMNSLIKKGHLTSLNNDDIYKHFKKETPFHSVYIIFNYACNMACVYCFEGKHKAKHIMSDDTFNYVIKYIDFLSSSKNVEIVFYGGEPLLKSNRKRISHILELYKNNPNIYYRFITNGLNISNYLDLFKTYKNKISRFVITIDGDEQTHNSKRVRHDKSGTYSEIISSINLLTNNNFFVTIRINVDKESLHKQKKSISELNRLITHKENLNIDIHIIHYRYNDHYNELTLEELFSLRNELKIFNDINITYSHPILRFCTQPEMEKNIYPTIYEDRCAYNSNRIIDPNGNVYKCTEAMGNDDLCIGNIRNQNSLNEHFKCIECKPTCKACDYYLLCYGKCSIQNYIELKKNQTGTMSRKSTS